LHPTLTAKTPTPVLSPHNHIAERWSYILITTPELLFFFICVTTLFLWIIWLAVVSVNCVMLSLLGKASPRFVPRCVTSSDAEGGGEPTRHREWRARRRESLRAENRKGSEKGERLLAVKKNNLCGWRGTGE
jgi:hypothetical protein